MFTSIMRIIPISQQARGQFNNGQILENKPIGFPQDGGFVRPYSSLFYWAKAEAVVDSTIGLHPHQGFEIMSFVLEGNIRHFDTKQNAWIPLSKGDVQIIRAGNGISHAEHIEKGGVIFQIWLDPDLSKTLSKEATYSDYTDGSFNVEESQGVNITRYAGTGGRMELDTVGTDIRKIVLTDRSYQLNGDEKAIHSMYILRGSGMVNGQSVEKDDFIIIDDGAAIEMVPHAEGLEVFSITTPRLPAYKMYADLWKS
jgi:redox-sensitive bicupin YhaK (pirin superfamily)